MRRATAVLLVLVFLLSAVSCGEKKTAGSFSAASLKVLCNGKTFAVNQTVDEAKLAALGEPARTVAQQSCHYSENGDEYWMYYYFGAASFDDACEDLTDALAIHTVPLRAGENTICDIECHTARAYTDKGLTVGSSMREVLSAYGDGYVDEGDGFLTYYDGEALPETPRLMFHMKNGAVEYFAVSAAINL